MKATSYWPIILIGCVLIIGGIILAFQIRPVRSNVKYRVEGTSEVKPAQPLDVNSASYDQLRAIPFVTESTARSIINLRPFKQWEDLDAVYGIGPKKLESLREYLFIAPSGTADSQP